MHTTAWDWIGPLLLVAVYGGLAVYYYPWLVLQARRRLRRIEDLWRDLFVYALRWPLLIVLSVLGVTLLTENWPLTSHARDLFRAAEHIAIIVVLVLMVQRWVIAAYRFSGEASWLRITLLRKLILILLYAIATLMIMDELEIKIGALLVSLGIGSLAVGLALKDILANFFAGIQLSMERQLERGQLVTMENGMTGQVLWINWMNTQLRAEDGSLVIVPNAKLLGFIIQNLTLAEPQVTLAVVLPLDRTGDLDRAEQVALDTARQVLNQAGVAGVPFAHYTRLTAAAAELTVLLGAPEAAALKTVRGAYLKAVNRALTQAGIKLA